MIHQLRFLGDPVLHHAALPCNGRDISALVESMKMLCVMHDGVGIAAPQVGSGLRVFIAHLSTGTVVAVDPVLSCSGQKVLGLEGCLSLPGRGCVVERSSHARLEALDPLGAPFVLEATGFDARILQHEMDHLDGLLISDKVD